MAMPSNLQFKLPRYQADHVWVGDQRCYEIKDSGMTKIYPGVTTLLSKTKPLRDQMALDKWRNKIGEDEAKKILEDSRNRGTQLHENIENFFAKKNSPFVNVPEYWFSAKPIVEKIKNIYLIEAPVWHPLGFAGTVDCVAEYEGTLSIIDWKTSAKSKLEDWIFDYKLQLSAYCAAVNRLYDLRIGNGIVFIFLPNKSAQVFKFPPKEMGLYWKEFKKRYKEYKELFPDS